MQNNIDNSKKSTLNFVILLITIFVVSFIATYIFKPVSMIISGNNVIIDSLINQTFITKDDSVELILLDDVNGNYAEYTYDKYGNVIGSSVQLFTYSIDTSFIIANITSTDVTYFIESLT